jgi:intracellular multiplication protein IcmK
MRLTFTLAASSVAASLLCCQTVEAQQTTTPPANPALSPAASPPAAPAASVPQWVKAQGENSATAFPPQPGTQNRSQQMQAAFPQSSYGAASYVVPGQSTAGPRPGLHDGTAPLPPLAPPTNYQQASALVSPLPDSDIKKLREKFDSSRKAKAYRPVRTSPRIRSTSVDLAPGSALPILRTLPGETSTVVFLDAAGTPWPLAAVPRVSRTDVAAAEWLEGSPSVVVSLLSPYEEANLTAFLSGLATPVVVKLSAGEPASSSQTREVDYRLDLRVPGRSPYAKAPVASTAKIALYDDTMQSFLDGIPPPDAVQLKAHGEVPARTSVWQYAGALFVRTSHGIQTAFDNTLASSDGTRVYRLPPTPFVTLSDTGRSVTFQVDIQ